MGQEKTARRIKLLDIMAGKESGEREQMSKHSKPLTNGSKAGLTGRVSKTKSWSSTNVTLTAE